MKKIIQKIRSLFGITTAEAVAEEAKVVSLIEWKGRKTIHPGSLRARG